MQIETVLLVLESVLLVFTIALLLYSIREGRGRDAMLAEIGRATKILTRHEYFLQVRDSMTDAGREVVGIITGRLPSEDDRKRTDDIVECIERLAKRGIKVRYLMPKFPDRLHIGSRYTNAGAEVRFSGGLIVNDIRYIVVDEQVVVFGIPETIGEKEATKKGYRLPSEGLAAILSGHFYGCWEKNITYEDYVREVVSQAGATSRLLALELQIDAEELERLAGKR